MPAGPRSHGGEECSRADQREFVTVGCSQKTHLRISSNSARAFGAGGKELISLEEMVGKVRAAVDTRRQDLVPAEALLRGGILKTTGA
jgi:hypothetical protein